MIECFGPEASARAHQLLDGQDVRLVFDPSQGRKDYYDRTLAYVETRGGADFGRTMVRGGFAAEYTYDTAYQRQGSYQAAEQDARAANRGLWAKCGGPHKAPSAPETTPEPETTEPDSGGHGGGGGGGAGGCADGYDPCVPPFPPDVNCDDVDGPITVTGSDPHGLDADGDGIACES
ncbi:MAG: thermonuclease family protein [Nocardioidaceae bacterium]|nr:thermonuclease family protein [Nocardioidaceae bacterium]